MDQEKGRKNQTYQYNYTRETNTEHHIRYYQTISGLDKVIGELLADLERHEFGIEEIPAASISSKEQIVRPAKSNGRPPRMTWFSVQMTSSARFRVFLLESNRGVKPLLQQSRRDRAFAVGDLMVDPAICRTFFFRNDELTENLPKKVWIKGNPAT
jgi:hypothetical protein